MSQQARLGAATERRIYPDTFQVALRSLVVLGAMTSLLAALAAGARPAGWVQLVLLGLAVMTAVRPESVAGVGVLCGAAYAWALSPEPLSPLVLLAAGGMVLAHVSALVAADGPATMRVDAGQVRLWAVRGVLLVLAATVVWGLCLAMADLADRRLAYAVGLAVLIAATVTTAASIGRRPSDSG